MTCSCNGTGCSLKQPQTSGQPASYDDLLRLDIRIGTIISAELHVKARQPMYSMLIEFGPEIGVKSTCAMITENYPEPSKLVGLQIAAATNLPVKLIAGVKSEVLLLAATDPGGSVLMVPRQQVESGVAVR